jgi:hypothetical protein
MTRVARTIVLGLVLAVAAPAAPVFAKAKLLKRSASNVLQAPVDALAIPYTFPETFVHGLYFNKRFSPLEKVVFTPIWGIVYLPACTFVSAAMPAVRFLEGVALMPVGLATVNSDYDWALYQPMPGKRNALIQKKPLYMGGRYCEGFFQ